MGLGVTAYDLRAQATAAAKLAPIARGGKGQAVTLTWQASPTYNPDTGASTTPSPAAQNCSGIEEQYAAYFVNGTSVLTGDTKFMLSPLTIAGDVVDLHEGEKGKMTLTLADGSVKPVVRSEPFRPAGALVFAYLQIRGA